MRLVSAAEKRDRNFKQEELAEATYGKGHSISSAGYGHAMSFAI
jgi:hypothetical protein